MFDNKWKQANRITLIAVFFVLVFSACALWVIKLRQLDKLADDIADQSQKAAMIAATQPLGLGLVGGFPGEGLTSPTARPAGPFEFRTDSDTASSPPLRLAPPPSDATTTAVPELGRP